MSREAALRLKAALANPTLILGARTERIFEATVLSLGRHPVLQTRTTSAYEKGMLTQSPAQHRGSPASLPAPPEQQDMLNRTLAA